MSDIIIAPALPEDIDAIMAVQNNAYSAITPENRETMASRIKLAPEGCFTAKQNGMLMGYILSHPFIAGEIPPLGKPLEQLPPNADSWYLHDLALECGLRGTGAAALLVNAVKYIAAKHGFQQIFLVSIQQSSGFWRKMGFAELLPEDVPLRQFNRQEHPLRGRVEVAERHVEEQFLSRVCVRTGDLGRRDGDVGRLPAE